MSPSTGDSALAGALQACRDAQALARSALATDATLGEAYRALLPKLRGLYASDPDKHKALRKDAQRALDPVPARIRSLMALCGSADGLSRVILLHLPAFGLEPQERLNAALLCTLEEPEKALTHLPDMDLAAPQAALVAQAAATLQPPLDYEEFKKVEVHYLAGDSDDPGAKEDQRRLEQARGKCAQHVRRHLLSLLPPSLRSEPSIRTPFLELLLEKDPFGTVESLRKEPEPRSLEGMPDPWLRHQLLRLAEHGLGFASNYLDLFPLAETEDRQAFLEQVFRTDLIAGSSIFGACALEGAHHYPFGLTSLEPLLPRRMGTADAVLYLKKRLPAGGEANAKFRDAEVQATLLMLQEKEVQTFLQTLKGEIGLQWKTHFPEAKRTVVFGDLELKIRNILFLLAHALFRDNEIFERLLVSLQEAFPTLADQPETLARMANRHFFLETIGFNPSLLFARPKESAAPALIETVGDYPIRTFLHVGMSIHLRIGEALFRSAPIAWNMLLSQYEKLDSAMQALAFMLEGFDTLYTVAEPLVDDLATWTTAVVDALARSETTLPDPEALPTGEATLRLMSRATVDRCRETLNLFCIQMVRRHAQVAGTTPTAIIQSLRLPRSRTDRLFALLEEEKKRARG